MLDRELSGGGQHSTMMVGRGYPMLTAGDSDGVVPVSSARHPGVQTETLVRA